MDAIDLLARYAGADSDQKLYAAGDKVPVDGVVPKAWLDGVVDDGQVERIPYELCVLIALRDALRRREVYVKGAGRWTDPDEDLPGDFEDNRDVHYAELGKPPDPTEFVADLRKRLDDGLTGSIRPLVRPRVHRPPVAQHPDRLTEASGITRIFAEKISTRALTRPEWTCTRLGVSARHLSKASETSGSMTAERGGR